MVSKHILGHNRTVIAKKPRKYTPAYNYRENQWRQSPTPNHDLIRDHKRAAKEPGWRPVFDKNGNVDHYYFERRANRSDTQKQRRTALGLKSKDSRYSSRGQKVVIDRQRPKVTLIIPEIPKPEKGGKYFNPQPKKPLTKSELKGIIQKAELSIHTKPVENLFVFDVNRGIVFSNTNNKKNWVRETPKFRDWNTYIMTHNHPNTHGNPNPLSGEDIGCLFYYKRLEVRACCYGYVYRIRKGNAKDGKGSYYQGQWNRTVNKIIKVERDNYPAFEYIDGEDVSKTELRKKAYLKALDAHIWSASNKALEEFCKKHGFWYKFERI